jgi:hypothetical protein
LLRNYVPTMLLICLKKILSPIDSIIFTLLFKYTSFLNPTVISYIFLDSNLRDSISIIDGFNDIGMALSEFIEEWGAKYVIYLYEMKVQHKSNRINFNYN